MKTLKVRRPLPRNLFFSIVYSEIKRMSTFDFSRVEYLEYLDLTTVFFGRRVLAPIWNEGIRGKEQWALKN